MQTQVILKEYRESNMNLGFQDKQAIEDAFNDVYNPLFKELEELGLRIISFTQQTPTEKVITADYKNIPQDWTQSDFINNIQETIFDYMTDFQHGVYPEELPLHLVNFKGFGNTINIQLKY